MLDGSPDVTDARSYFEDIAGIRGRISEGYPFNKIGPNKG